MARQLAYDPKYALNAICPYFTMFPLEYPLEVLEKHKKEKPIVFDPFCGRGTSIYAARKLGLDGWGFDTSPIAVAIAKAKLASANLDEILSKAENLIKQEPSIIPDSEFFKLAFSRQTLKEVCSLREGLLQSKDNSDATVLLRAASLGCLHGPLNKSIANASYFSNQMPRTFSSKPNYSVKYWRSNNLLPPKISTIDVLRKKLSRIKDLESKSLGGPDQVFCEDARSINAIEQLPRNISTIITSPPYYGMRTYVQDQWLRLWFLGGPETVDYRNDDQINHNSQEVFTKDLAQVWENILSLNQEEIDLYVRFGTVPSIKSDARSILQSSLEICGGWKIISIKNAQSAHSGKRQAQQMVAKSKATQEYDFHAVRL
ncbi:MAG: site-specific DNA-methyltransferase [Bacteroidia bacterium]|nr:site-specific DNA-methyltransferase [Bacteroidia bacterium]